jgi:hypothetical protein
MAEQRKSSRRTFFAGLGIAAAAGVTAKLTANPVAQVVDATAPTPGDKAKLSEHIKKYYRTTTI